MSRDRYRLGTGRYRSKVDKSFYKTSEDIEYMTIKNCYYCKEKAERFFHIWNKLGRYVIGGCNEHAGLFEEEMTAYRFEEISYEDIAVCEVLLS